MVKKILIVDDSAFMRAIIKNNLRNLKLEIHEAKDGEEALEIFIRELPDLVTLDLTMPNKSGMDVLKKMKKIAPNVKVLVCSSMVNKRAEEETKMAGAIEFIKKPFRNENFIKIIKKHLK